MVSVEKAKPGMVLIYTEMGYIYLVRCVRIIPSDDMHRLELRILKSISHPENSHEEGTTFSVGKSKGPGGGCFGGWYLRNIDSPYSEQFKEEFGFGKTETDAWSVLFPEKE